MAYLSNTFQVLFEYFEVWVLVKLQSRFYNSLLISLIVKTFWNWFSNVSLLLLLLFQNISFCFEIFIRGISKKNNHRYIGDIVFVKKLTIYTGIKHRYIVV